MKDRDLYSIEEARERLGGISRNTIYEMLRKGQLASVILGCRRFIAADAIAKLISDRQRRRARLRTPRAAISGSRIPRPSSSGCRKNASSRDRPLAQRQSTNGVCAHGAH